MSRARAVVIETADGAAGIDILGIRHSAFAGEDEPFHQSAPFRARETFYRVVVGNVLIKADDLASAAHSLGARAVGLSAQVENVAQLNCRRRFLCKGAKSR